MTSPHRAWARYRFMWCSAYSQASSHRDRASMLVWRLDEVSSHLPRFVRCERQCDNFSGSRLLGKRRVKVNDDVLTGRSSDQRRLVLCSTELSGGELPEGG